MPRTVEIDGTPMVVATEKELLDFANSIRQAGGADVLEALLPSSKQNPSQCLLANALNFGCSVDSHIGDSFADGSDKWQMWLPELTAEQRQAIAKVKGVRLCRDKFCGEWYLTLPKHIGNAALAFDEGAAFQNYARA